MGTERSASASVALFPPYTSSGHVIGRRPYGPRTARGGRRRVVSVDKNSAPPFYNLLSFGLRCFPMIQALKITVPEGCTTVEAQLIRAVIVSHHETLAAAIMAAFPEETPPESMEKLFEHTVDFARRNFPGTTVIVDPDLDLYQGTVIDELRGPEA